MAETVTSRQFWIQEPGRGEILRREIPPRRADEVLVRNLFSGISRGTESLVFHGRVPRSEREAMRAPFQEGDFPAPVKYGYTGVGRVLAGPDDASRELAGRIVFCLHPHQDLYHVPASSVHPIPDDLPPGRAVLAANMETAVNVLWDGRPCVGDRIIVVGGGVVGLLIAWLCRDLPGVRLTLLDTDPGRAEVAARLDIPFSQDAAAVPGGADVVFHASGNPDGLAVSLAAAGTEATVVEASWFGTRPVPLPLGREFHSRRLSIRSSQVGRLPPDRQPRWEHRKRMALALDLLRAPELDVLITGEHPFDELPRVLARVSEGPEGVLCERIRYPRPPDEGTDRVQPERA